MARISYLAAAAILACTTQLQAQPDVPDTTEHHVTVSTGAKGLRLNVDCTKSPLVPLIEKIATRGNLNVIVHGDVNGELANFELKDVEPETALFRVALAGNLQFQKSGRVFILKPEPLPDEAAKESRPGPKLDIVFQGVNVLELLQLVGDGTQNKVQVDPDVKQTLTFIHLKAYTFAEAIDQITEVTGLTWREGGNDNYIVSVAGGDENGQ